YLPNGTFSISVNVPAGYSAVLTSPTFTVAGTLTTAPAVRVNAMGGHPSSPGGGLGATGGAAWMLWAAGLTIALLVGVILGLVLRGRMGPSAAGPGRSEGSAPAEAANHSPDPPPG
ncbi:MAG: hypothetical protein L3K11_07420, partial [Thermoplasmata archaeon]|nr:hypothetical protein [Thermoplasmata archaeon]